MSSFTSYDQVGAPPPSVQPPQMNMVNGIIPVQQHQQKQQQILQHKQQIQQSQQHGSLPPPSAFNSSALNKFLPPAAVTSTILTTATTAPLPISTTGTATTTINGPLIPNPKTYLPAQSRPPKINGPLIYSSNGTADDTSTNSSRAASPALQTISLVSQPLQQHHQQLQQQSSQGSQAAAVSAELIRTEPTPLMPNIGNMTESMQNLNLNRINGTSGVRAAVGSAPLANQQPILSSTSNVRTGTSWPANIQRQPQYKTSALNSAALTSAPLAIQTLTSTTSQQRTSILNAASNMMFNQMAPSGTHSSNIFGTSVAPPMYTNTSATLMQNPPLMRNSNYTSANISNVLGTQHSENAHQQNQLNNNQLQMPPTSIAAIPPPPSSMIGMQRKPMYFNGAQQPPMPSTTAQLQQSVQQRQQQFEPDMYADAYHHQQLPPQQQFPFYQQQHQQQKLHQPVMFNGQLNTGPLQYQSQTQMLPPSQFPQISVAQQGFNRLWGQDTIDLMQNRHILTSATVLPPKIVLHNQFHESINCNPSIMRCTISKIPESNSLLQKSRLPLGIVIHPFRDINSLPVIQCPNIVRCRLCRTYINPFVYFVDSKMWKCNLCYRVNELPDDFQFDPATKTYGDVTRRPEVRSSTIEFIAPSEYMLRPPQPAIYLFLFDVSIIAQQSGYIENACAVLSKHLDDMPGDARTQVGFIAYDSHVHFYSMSESYNQPHEMTLIDIEDPFLPRPDNLLVNLKECKDLVKDLLTQLPKRFADTHDPGSALGAALQVAYKLMQASGGRVTVFQTCLPNKGPGALEAREDPNNRSAKDVAYLNPATDFYKRFALECSGYQIAVDLFLLNQQYSDLATISGISKHSGGSVHHFPLYQKTKPQLVDSFKQCFKRYLVRKIGFEAVMRIRCTRGLQVHTFHGNFFVRSTDLLSLPNVNPDAGYGMQISYEESLTDVKTICFQAALLYTNSEGERRIRVHTLCLPVTASLPEVMHAADTEAIIGLLSKMAVDRSITSNLADAREAFINATVDILNAFKIAQNLPSGQTGQLITPRSLALLPLYILALLKHPAFRVGTSTRLDDRVYAMDCMKTLPLDQLMKFIYPEFYNIDVLFYNSQNSNATASEEDEDDDLPEVQRLQLSAEYLDSRSIFLLDCSTLIIIYVGLNVSANILDSVLGVKSTAELPDYCYGLPAVSSLENDALKRFVMRLNDEKPYTPLVQIIRDTSTAKPQFIEKLVDDRSESSLSYYEFLQHIRTQVK